MTHHVAVQHQHLPSIPESRMPKTVSLWLDIDTMGASVPSPDCWQVPLGRHRFLIGVITQHRRLCRRGCYLEM